MAQEVLTPCAPLFPAEAAAARDIFDQLRIVDVLGKPTFGEVSRPWVTSFVEAIFGAYDPTSGRRLITEFFMLISKKNTKSTTAAGIMLTALLLNWRESAEFLILAPTVEVANNSFKPARDAIKADEELDSMLLVQDHIRTITHRVTGAVLKVVAAESDTVSGKKATGVLVDELWAFGTKPNAHSMLLEATGGLTSRPEGFVIYLSTQSDEPPAGVFDEKLKYARDVRDGKIEDNRFMPVLYEFPERMLRARMHLDKKNFYVTNPNLGASVDVPYIEREFDKNLRAGEAELKSFLAKHLNIQVALSLAADRWAGADFWETAAQPGLTLQRILETSEVVTIGIDGGGLDDLLGVCVLGRERGTRRWLHWAHAWAHRIVLDRRKDIANDLLGFEKDGDLTIVANPGDDVQAVADLICGIRDKGLLPEENAIGVDAAGIGDINDELTTEARGFTLNKEIKAVGQGWRLNGAIKTTERKVAGRDLVHCNTRLMNFCVGNAKAEVRSNATLITKQVSGSAKIDPLMATFNAVAFMAMNPEAVNMEPTVRWL